MYTVNLYLIIFSKRGFVKLPKDKRFINLTGFTFGRLLVKEYAGMRTPDKKNKNHQWLCICDCNNKTIVVGNHLKSGVTRSCGCYQKDRVKETCFHDIAGKLFGKLTVIEHLGKKGDEHQWKCQCSCSNITIVNGGNLSNNPRGTKSCGCSRKESIRKRFIDLSGKTFGKITVIKFVKHKYGHSYWHCQCSCGNTKTISGSNLRKGLTTSCGCYAKVARKTHGLSGTPEYKKLRRQNPVEHIKHNVSCLIRHALKSKNISKNGISIFKQLPYTALELKQHLESLWTPWMTWENFGGQANDSRQTWHIDHIIPQKSFNFTSIDDEGFKKCWSLENLQPLEKQLNYSKGSKCN
jgi:hypothetical protein